MLQPNLTLMSQPCLSPEGNWAVRVSVMWGQASDTLQSSPPSSCVPQTCSSLYLLHLRIRVQLFINFFLATNLGVFLESGLPSPTPPWSWQCCVHNVVLVYFSTAIAVVLVPSSPAWDIPIVHSLPLSSTSVSQQPEGSTDGVNHFVSLPDMDPSNTRLSWTKI